MPKLAKTADQNPSNQSAGCRQRVGWFPLAGWIGAVEFRLSHLGASYEIRLLGDPRMGWSNYYVLVPVKADKETKKLARKMAERYKVPTANRLAHRDNDDLKDFTVFQKGSLSALDFDTKLIICAHGSSRDVAGWGPDLIGYQLMQLGVKKVGLIAFKCCEVGKRDFLEQLKVDLGKRGISFGYLIAYKESVWLQSGGKMRDFFGRSKVPVRIVKGDAHVPIPNEGFLKLEERMLD